MKITISNLPQDLVEEILSRIPVKSMGAIRYTCKKWKALSNDTIFTNKHISKASREKEFLMVTRECRVYLMRVNLYKTHDKNFDISINPKGKLITRETSSDQVISITSVCHCNGLLLCVLRDINNRLVFCNPYLGNRRWIKRPKRGCYTYLFAFGYDKSCGSHKILRFYDNKLNMYFDQKEKLNMDLNMDIYDLSDNSWRALDDTFQKNLSVYLPGVSLHGNTYWIASDKETPDHFLLCFDFSRERFGPRLPLPGDSSFRCNVSIFAVREENLALLAQPRYCTFQMEVWVTNKIEPHAVSWSNFFKVDMKPLARIYGFRHFFIDEEKKLAVVFCEGKARIIGENGFYRIVDLRKSADIKLRPFVSSYVPTSLQIK